MRRWPLWALAPRLRAYVVSVVLLAAAAIVVGLARTPVRASELAVFALLIGCGVLSVETTRRLGQPAGTAARDLLSAWWLPIAFLLPPVYALLAPIPILALTDLRVRRTVLHRRVFSAAAIGLANGAASLAFHSASDAWSLGLPEGGVDALRWTAVAAACALLAAALNAVLVAVAVRATSPEVSWSSLFGRDSWTAEATELCTGLVIALIAGLHALLAIVGLLPVLVLQRSLLHDQLRAAARTDAKTGLLNAAAWERETASEVSRAYRSRSPLAVMLIDIDFFKRVNDEHGHLAGDDVLRSVARTMQSQLRHYDLLARFGGEEFAVLLPQTDVREAMQTAERLRRSVAGVRVPSGETLISVTISVGVAPLSAPGLDVADLLAAADSALYHAKAAGRDQVHIDVPAG